MDKTAFTLLLLAGFFGEISCERGQKTFLIYSYSEVYHSKSYALKLLNIFSNTFDGKMLKISGNFDDDNETLTMNVNLSGYEIIKQNYSSAYIEVGCKRKTVQTESHTFALLSKTAESAIIINGCEESTMEIIKLFFIESLVRKIDSKIIETLSQGPEQSFVNQRAENSDDVCTCKRLLKEKLRDDKVDITFRFIGIGIVVTFAIIFILVKIFEVLDKEERLPFLP